MYTNKKTLAIIQKIAIQIKKLYKKFLTSLLLLLPLVACGPTYITEYEMIPPDTQFGSMCANNCLLSKTNCENYCMDRANQNRLIKKLEEKIDSDSDKKSVYKFNFSSGNFSSGDDDRCERRCTADYHACYVNCGGRIIPHTYPTKFGVQ